MCFYTIYCRSLCCAILTLYLLPIPIKEQKFREERSTRLGQIEENKNKREAERQLRIDQEKAYIQRSHERANEENEEKLKIKEKQKAAQDQLYVENERYNPHVTLM
jgi:hypothetical protein